MLATDGFCFETDINAVSGASGKAKAGIAFITTMPLAAGAKVGNFNTLTTARTRFNDIWLLF